jgi:hypothetical protein
VSGHVKWTDPRWPDINWKEIDDMRPGVISRTRVWVEGYVAAMEDVIRELDQMSQDAEKVPYDTQTLMFAKIPFKKDLATAQRTLDQLNKIKEEPNDSEQGQG